MSAAEAVIQVQPFAERLRYKGKTFRFTRGGETFDYRVVRVSFPDQWGRCQLTLEPTAATPEGIAALNGAA